jgi:hypothetical protein
VGDTYTSFLDTLEDAGTGNRWGGVMDAPVIEIARLLLVKSLATTGAPSLALSSHNVSPASSSPETLAAYSWGPTIPA